MLRRLPALLLTALFVSTGAAAQTPPTIVTVAGGGLSDVAARSALLYPYAVAIDTAGNAYLIEGSRIYKVDASTGQLTTIAGTNVGGFSGDGGLATMARLSSPYGLALDPAGSLYVADFGNGRVRKVDLTSGIITTVAGGGTLGDGNPAINARLFLPYGIARDGNGNLFVSEYYGHKVRRIDGATGIITTVAGNGTAGFAGDGGPGTSAMLKYPRGLAVDPAGNVYIADTDNARIRRVDMTTGLIATVAGNGVSEYGNYAGDGGSAVNASLIHPDAVAVDAAGNLFVADYDSYDGDGSMNSRVRRVDAATGIITRYAGGGGLCCSNGDGAPATAGDLYYPEGLAFDTSGNLFIADTGQAYVLDGVGGWIRRVDATTGLFSSIAGGGRSIGDGGTATDALLEYPDAITYDAAGDLFIGDYSNLRVRRVDAGTKRVTTVAGGGEPGYCGDGGPAVDACMWEPRGVAVDGSGNIFISDSYGHRIRRVDAATGIITTYAGNGVGGYSGDGGPATSAGLNWPYGVAVDSADNLLIADTYTFRIRRVNASTGIIVTVAGNGVYGFGGDNGPATLASLAQPTGVAADAAGNVFIADRDNCRIRRVDASTGIITTYAGDGTCAYGGDGGPAASAQLNLPSGIALDALGDLLIADEYDARIRRVDAATGIITTVAGSGVEGFSGDAGPATSAKVAFKFRPIGVAFHPDGSFAFTDTRNNRVRQVSSQSLAAGAVPDDAYASGAAPLSISALPNGDVSLSWGASCLGSDTDYEIYEGALGNFASLVPRLCSTQGNTSVTLRSSQPDAYYLVVPRNSFKEGSYGQRSDGTERPRGVSACLPREVATTCQP